MQINSFQEQPYLLDPYLEEMVLPIVETLKSHVKVLVTADPENVRVTFRFVRICSLLYTFIKFRGYKTIGADNSRRQRQQELMIEQSPVLPS